MARRTHFNIVKQKAWCGTWMLVHSWLLSSLSKGDTCEPAHVLSSRAPAMPSAGWGLPSLHSPQPPIAMPYPELQQSLEWGMVFIQFLCRTTECSPCASKDLWIFREKRLWGHMRTTAPEAEVKKPGNPTSLLCRPPTSRRLLSLPSARSHQRMRAQASPPGKATSGVPLAASC